MRTRSMTILGAMGALFFAMIAHSPQRALAAPGPAAPRPSPTATGMSRPRAVASPLVVDVRVIPVASRCGEPIQGRVRLANKTKEPWTGAIELGGVTTPVKLGAAGPGAEWSYDLRAGKLDCGKQLGSVPLKVTKAAGVGPALLFNRPLKPTTVVLMEHFDPHQEGGPPHGKLWLRQLNVSGSCGGAVTGAARFEQQGGGAGPAATPGGGGTGAILRLGLGDKTQEVPVAGGPSGTTALLMQFAINGASFDCSAGGFPVLEYAVRGGGGKVLETSGKTSSYMVTFAP